MARAMRFTGTALMIFGFTLLEFVGYELVGTTIQANAIAWYLPTVRRLFLWWQERVNGFRLLRRERTGRLFVFRCTHFDEATRSCDSYSSRPGMCRDYPRALLGQALPQFLPGCGYRAVTVGGERLRKALEEQKLPPEQLERLKKGLHLDE